MMSVKSHTIKNDTIELTISELGAQMQSMRAFGVEYLWQGDQTFWKDRATNLFPYIGRFSNGKYKFKGEEYPMCIHGFAKLKDFVVTNKNESQIEFTLRDDKDTYLIYPFHFELTIRYALSGNRINIEFHVKNRSEQAMYFGIGGHPGFNVPLEPGLGFEDYALEFKKGALPDRVVHTPDNLLSGSNTRYTLIKDDKLALKHDLFDHDAVVLQNMANRTTLISQKGERKVTVHYPDMNYLGIWHTPRKEAPFVCIEPWTSLPSRQDVIEDIEFKSDLVKLPAGMEYTNKWNITLG